MSWTRIPTLHSISIDDVSLSLTKQQKKNWNRSRLRSHRIAESPLRSNGQFALFSHTVLIIHTINCHTFRCFLDFYDCALFTKALLFNRETKCNGEMKRWKLIFHFTSFLVYRSSCVERESIPLRYLSRKKSNKSVRWWWEWKILTSSLLLKNRRWLFFSIVGSFGVHKMFT